MKKSAFLVATSLVLLGIASPALAAGLPHTIDVYAIILHALHADHMWFPTVGALFATVLITIVGLGYRASVARSASGADTPDGRFSMRFVVEGIMDFVFGLAKDNTHEKARTYLPFLATLFIFILVNNLMGLVPGFPPATVSMDTNVAMGLIVFAVYNYAGLKEHGFGYVKHFLGPVAAIAPIFFAIELVSHGARPLSLGLRLAGNIYGDHTLLSVFTSLSYIVLPALLMFFGLLVAVVQSFVFTLLTGIYISMAMSHDH